MLIFTKKQTDSSGLVSIETGHMVRDKLHIIMSGGIQTEVSISRHQEPGLEMSGKSKYTVLVCFGGK